MKYCVLLICFIISSTMGYAQIKSFKTYERSDIDGKSHISEFKKFDKKGNLLIHKEYDSEGKLESTIEYIYAENKLVEKSEIGIEPNYSDKTKYAYESNIKTTQVFRDNKLAYITKETFNKAGDITSVFQDVNGETLTTDYNYKYNANGKPNKVTSVLNGVEELYKIYKYNSEGKEIEVLKYGLYLNYKTTTEYKNNVIYRILKTQINRANTENVESDIIYDEKFNPTHRKIYNEEKLNAEHQMTYEFDKNGNWTKKIVKTKDFIFDRSKTFKPNYTQIRKIKYW